MHTDAIPSDVEQATGLEKKELDALMAGVDVSLCAVYVHDLIP